MGDVTKFSEFAKRYMQAYPDRELPEPVPREDRAEDRARRLASLDRSGCKLEDADRELIANASADPSEALLQLGLWFKNPQAPAWLVLSGATGRGKTLALATLASKETARYVGAERLCRVFSGNFGDSIDAQERILNSCLLLLDDVGTETDDRRMQTTLLELFDARRSRTHAPTVIATNLDKKGFATRYPNERLHSRLNRVQWVSVGGEDLRRRKS